MTGLATTEPECARALGQLDDELSAFAPMYSLCPGRGRATPLRDIAAALLDRTVPRDVAEAWCSGLGSIVRAVVEHFPENLFWDFDYAGTSLLATALERSDGIERLHESCELSVALQRDFGRRSRIGFRYSHDFLYGFDWAKWVSRAPDERASVGPFSLEFLRYLDRRGHELLDLIARDDDTYPKLPSGAPRNPFAFSREPGDELRLHRDLAERGLIPVESWRPDAVPRWQRPYRQLREQRACALGIRHNDAVRAPLD